MELGFTGTRKGLTEHQYSSLLRLLNAFHAQHGLTSVHHGDCVGADAEFHDLATDIGGIACVRHIYPGNIPTLRANCKGEFIEQPKPFLARNRDIVNASDCLIACPAEMEEQTSGGTWYTARYACTVGKRVFLVLPDGSEREFDHKRI